MLLSEYIFFQLISVLLDNSVVHSLHFTVLSSYLRLAVLKPMALVDNYRHIHIYENCSANMLSVSFSIVVTSPVF